MIRNIWSRIARIFGGTVNNVGNGPKSEDWPGSGDCDSSDDFRSATPPACDPVPRLPVTKLLVTTNLHCIEKFPHCDRFQYVTGLCRGPACY